MAAGAESSFLRYANDGSTQRADVPVKWRILAKTSLNYPHDAVAGSAPTTADSMGMFQQRPMYGYGAVQALMDPFESTLIFLQGAGGQTRGFLNAPANLTLAQRVQWTQGSEFPTGDNYAPWQHVAVQLASQYLQTKGAS